MTESLDIELRPADNERLANLCGPMNENLRQIEASLGVEINNRSHHFQLIGEADNVKLGACILKDLYKSTIDQALTANLVHLQLQGTGLQQLDAQQQLDANQWNLRLKKALLKAVVSIR